MSALIKTSTFALLRPTGDDWGGDSATFDETDRVGGTLSGGYSVSDQAGNVLYQYKLTLDVCVINENYRVKDLSTDIDYDVFAVERRTSLIPCVVARVSRATATP